MDPGFLNDGDERPLGRLARLEEGREVGALAQLGDPQVERAEPGLQRPVAVAVAPGRPPGAALVPAGADHPVHLELHQPLQHQLGHLLQEIAGATLLQQLQQCHFLLGHRLPLRFGSGLATRPYPMKPMTTPSDEAGGGLRYRGAPPAASAS